MIHVTKTLLQGVKTFWDISNITEQEISSWDWGFHGGKNDNFLQGCDAV